MPRQSDIELLCERLSSVFRTCGAQKAILFGSRARGTHERHSDTDLIVVDDADLPYLRRLDKYYEALNNAVGGAVDVFVYRPQEFESMRDLPFLRNAIKQGTVPYER